MRQRKCKFLYMKYIEAISSRDSNGFQLQVE